MFSVELSRRARKELDFLDDAKIREVLEYLKLDPVPAKIYDVRKMEGSNNSFRIRVGKIRILYTIIWHDKAILVSRIEKRGTAYD